MYSYLYTRTAIDNSHRLQAAHMHCSQALYTVLQQPETTALTCLQHTRPNTSVILVNCN